MGLVDRQQAVAEGQLVRVAAVEFPGYGFEVALLVRQTVLFGKTSSFEPPNENPIDSETTDYVIR